jgi:glucose-1-phosphate thymidylyltransferase
MKGVVLAGGTGSRLFPLTKITNKHLLPIYEKPMIYYPIETMVDAGIRDILIVTGGKNAGDFLRLLANGKQFGLSHIDYTYQEGEGGIADALALAEHFADGQKLCVILGDNIVETSIRKAADDFRQQAQGAKILLKEVVDAERFGVAEISGNRIANIEEKPRHPKSNYAVTGIYMYDATVFDKVRTLVPSKRGELEITDVNNAYIQEGSMTFDFLDGWWTDAGTFDSLAARREPGFAVGDRAPPGGGGQTNAPKEPCDDGGVDGSGGARAAADRLIRCAGTRASRVPQRHRIGDCFAHGGGSDRRRAHRSVGAVARRSGLFPGGAAHRPGLGGGLPARNHADFDRLQLPRHDQGVSLSSAPDRLLDASDGNAAGGAGGSARGDPARSARGIPFTPASCGRGRS